MRSTVLKNAAIRARGALIAEISRLSEEHMTAPVGELTDRERILRDRLAELVQMQGAAAMTDEAAYIWFSRFIALRYMEANGLLGKVELTAESIIGHSRTLAESLPWIFGGSEWAELLFPTAQLDEGGALRELAKALHDKLLRGNVQLVGWLYQYYQSEVKDGVFADMKRNIKISGDNIAAATQVFTPDWIARYMVENSLGRCWVRGGDDRLPLPEWDCYISGNDDFSGTELLPENIRLIDPCVGCGHILAAAFDVLVQIYRRHGYDKSATARLIIERNLFGLDIDSRVCALSCFVLMMKAVQQDPDFLKHGITPNIEHFRGLPDSAHGELGEVAYRLHGAEIYGSLTDLSDIKVSESFTPEDRGEERLLRIYRILSSRYDVVCTNPPYMGAGGMNAEISTFIKRRYPEYSSDLFSAFTVRCAELAEESGQLGLLVPSVFMFIQSCEKLRGFIYESMTIESLIHFEYSAFGGATVPLCAFTLKNCREDRDGVYLRLTDFRGGMEIQRQKALAAISDRHCPYRYRANAADFSRIPGAPAAYWVSEAVRRAYAEYPPLGSIAAPRKGCSTSDNGRFLRLWYEVNFGEINLGCRELRREDTLRKRWYPYNKGGGCRKWYGFNDYLIDWYDDGAQMRSIKTAVIANYRYFMKPGLTWSTLTSGKFSIRRFEEGYIFDNGGCCIFELGEKRGYICALLNSKVFDHIFVQLNPTMNFQSGEVAKFPVKYAPNSRIDELSEECVSLSREDYDSFETSWDFRRHPLL